MTKDPVTIAKEAAGMNARALLPPPPSGPPPRKSTIKPRTTSLRTTPTTTPQITDTPRIIPKLHIDHRSVSVGNHAEGLSNLIQSELIDPTVNEPTTPIVSLEECKKMMQTSKESLAIANIVDASQMKENAEREFMRVCTIIRETHMKPAFASVFAGLDRTIPANNWSAKTATAKSLIHFFELVQTTDSIHQAVEVFFEESVVSASDSLIQKKSFIRDIDDTIAHGMDKAIQNLVNQVQRILDTTQGATDYNPPSLTNNGDESIHVFDYKPTRACLDVIECLEAHIVVLKGVTNKDTF
ncbi:UNVERIFIED_CONTAM: F-box protein: endocytic membrane traffic, recycling ReCYcling 1, partial [Siphonaria sp. JEL0065]